MSTNRGLPEHLLHIQNGEVVSTYDSIAAAQHAVNVLANSDFPVKEVAIVGTGVRLVERVMGKLSYGKVALTGAITGLYFAVAIVLLLIFVTGDPQSTIATALGIAVIGAALGSFLNVLTYWLNRNRKSYQSLGQLTAARYDLIAPRPKINTARQILATHAAENH